MRPRLSVACAAIPAILALGAAASLALLPRLDVPSRALAQPLLVVTSWGGSGIAAWLLLAATLVLAGWPYARVLAGLRAVEPPDRRSAWTILAASALSIAAVCAFRFVFSSDAYAYAAYGALAALGVDPYRIHAPFDIPLQNAAFTAAVRFEWPSLPTCVYGPAFVWIAREVVIAARGDAARVVFAFRSLASLAFLGSVALIAWCAPRRALPIAAAVGLNPIALWSLAEGHNDALAFAVATAGVVLARRRPRAGGLLAGASFAIKATGGVAALLAAYPLASRRFAAGAFGGIAAAVAVQAVAIAVAGGYQSQLATDFIGTIQAEIAAGFKGLLALVAAGFAVHHLTAGARLRALAAVTLAVWVAVPSPYAWYGIWLLPLAALTLETSEGTALFAATFCGLLRYLSDAAGEAQAAPWLSLAAGAIPIAVLAAPHAASAWRGLPAQKTPSR